MTKKRPVIRPLTLLCLGMLSYLLFTYPGQNYFQTLNVKAGDIKGESTVLPSMAIPLVTKQFDQSLTARAFIVFEPKSGTIVLEKNSDTPLPPASITKLMTALVAIDLYEPDDSLFVGQNSAEGQSLGLQKGTSLFAKDLLSALLIHSANDAALVLAQNHPSGYAGFLQDMNKKAVVLGLRNTFFSNVSGIGSRDHYTSVHDLVLLGKYALRNDQIKQNVQKQSMVIEDSKGNQYRLQTTNKLLGQVEGLLGLKTGWTEDAGECLISYLDRDGREVIIAVLGSNDRFGETKTLVDWYYQHTIDKVL